MYHVTPLSRHCVSLYVHIYHPDLLTLLPLPFLWLHPHPHMKNESEITFYKPQNPKESKTVSGKDKARKCYPIEPKVQRPKRRDSFTEMNFPLLKLPAHSFYLRPEVCKPKATGSSRYQRKHLSLNIRLFEQQIFLENNLFQSYAINIIDMT